ncbi:hypothetical protein D3C85_792650 [compost metagenome]
MASNGFALTASPFFKRQKGTKTLRPERPAPRRGSGFPRLRHSSGGIALRSASLDLHAMSSTVSRGAARHSPDERLRSACRWGGWIKSQSQSKIKSGRRANARPVEWLESKAKPKASTFGERWGFLVVVDMSVRRPLRSGWPVVISASATWQFDPLILARDGWPVPGCPASTCFIDRRRVAGDEVPVDPPWPVQWRSA